MLKEKAGVIAGEIWNALNEKGAMDLQRIKKVNKRDRKRFFILGLGWLLREDKVCCADGKFSLR